MKPSRWLARHGYELDEQGPSASQFTAEATQEMDTDRSVEEIVNKLLDDERATLVKVALAQRNSRLLVFSRRNALCFPTPLNCWRRSHLRVPKVKVCLLLQILFLSYRP